MSYILCCRMKTVPVITVYSGIFQIRKAPFNISEPCKCKCYSSNSDRIGSGSWSVKGLETDGVTSKGSMTTVRCSSTHLTSFAVLVSVGTTREVRNLGKGMYVLVHHNNRLLFFVEHCFTSCLLHWLYHLHTLSSCYNHFLPVT